MSILAAIDDSERAVPVLEEAHRLADDIGSEVHAVHVLTRSEMVAAVEKDVSGQTPTENHEVQQIGRDLVERAAGASTADAVNVVVRTGEPAEEIVDYAEETDARYVVIGGRTRSPTGKALFGSVTQQVLLSSPVPVLNVSLD